MGASYLIHGERRDGASSNQLSTTLDTFELALNFSSPLSLSSGGGIVSSQ